MFSRLISSQRAEGGKKAETVLLFVYYYHWGPYATGRLEDSGQQNDEKMSRKTGNAQSRATFFRHSAVLLRKVPIISSMVPHRLSTTSKPSSWNLKKYRSRYEGSSMCMASKKKKLMYFLHAVRGRVLPYMGYIGMCRCEGYGFQAVYSSIGYINQSVWV